MNGCRLHSRRRGRPEAIDAADPEASSVAESGEIPGGERLPLFSLRR